MKPMSYKEMILIVLFATVLSETLWGMFVETNGYKEVVMANIWFWYSLWLTHTFREKRMQPYNKDHTRLK